MFVLLVRIQGASMLGGLGGYDHNFGMGGVFGGGAEQGMPDCVLMVYGLNVQKINCQKLFNLFCLYGNVLRVSNCCRNVTNGICFFRFPDSCAYMTM